MQKKLLHPHIVCLELLLSYDHLKRFNLKSLWCWVHSKDNLSFVMLQTQNLIVRLPYLVVWFGAQKSFLAAGLVGSGAAQASAKRHLSTLQSQKHLSK